MAGAADKARFYLEKSVPQLKEFEEKKIFTKEEIRTLVKKRSDFEHKILARGTKPIDFARYAAWEINLEELRAKRCRRLKIKGSSAHAGQARIFSIFDRATRKHPGDLGLWMSYLEFARQVKATNKFKTALTAALRLHCTKSGLWLYAAKWALEVEADMSGARSYMQRGTRFCTRSKELWIEYARLEMIYLAKIGMRRKILGIDQTPSKHTLPGIEKIIADDPAFDTSEDMISVPDFKSQIQPSTLEKVGVDEETGGDLMETPALNGAIPLAIFNDARSRSFYNSSTAEDFFEMFSAFSSVAALSKIIGQVVDSMKEQFPNDPSTWICFVKQPVVGINPLDAEFPTALLESVDRFNMSSDAVEGKTAFSKKMESWIIPILALESLDPGIEKVLRFMLRKVQ